MKFDTDVRFEIHPVHEDIIIICQNVVKFENTLDMQFC